MTSTSDHPSDEINQLKQQCRYLKSRCADYVRALEKSNHDLADEIVKRRKAEEIIQKDHDRLEEMVAERTREIRKLRDRLQAENVILRQELADVQAFGTIIGQSYPIQAAFY